MNQRESVEYKVTAAQISPNLRESKKEVWINHTSLSVKYNYILLFLHCCKALAAVNRSVAIGLERNFSFLTAVSANSCKHLTGSFTCILAKVAAGLASLGLVLEAFLCVELLLACSEDELLSAIFALKGLVLVHWLLPHLKMVLSPVDNFDFALTWTKLRRPWVIYVLSLSA